MKPVDSNAKVPLYHADTHITITDHLAKIEVTQYYLNESDEQIEMEFSHPVHAKVVYGGFSMKVGNKILKSEVRKNKDAEIIYDDAVAAGKCAGMSWYVKNTQDIVKFFLGAIPPQEPIIVTATFYQILEVEDLSWKLFVPNVIVPWYFGQLKEYHDMIVLEDKIRAYYQNVKFTQKLTLNIHSKSPITRLISHSHIIKFISNQDNTEAFVELLDPDSFSNTSFDLLYRTDYFNKPVCLMQRVNENEHALIISFMADHRTLEQFS